MLRGLIAFDGGARRRKFVVNSDDFIVQANAQRVFIGFNFIYKKFACSDISCNLIESDLFTVIVN